MDSSIRHGWEIPLGINGLKDDSTNPNAHDSYFLLLIQNRRAIVKQAINEKRVMELI